MEACGTTRAQGANDRLASCSAELSTCWRIGTFRLRCAASPSSRAAAFADNFPFAMHQVIRMLGNGRLEGHCFDGQTRLCHIRGKMRKKVWVSNADPRTQPSSAPNATSLTHFSLLMYVCR